jgi:hypothetical protein
MEAETCPYRPDHLTQVAAVISAVIILIPEIQGDSDNRNCANDLHILNMMGIIELSLNQDKTGFMIPTPSRNPQWFY